MKTRTTFSESEEGKQVKLQLKEMTSNSSYITNPSYSANTQMYPDNLIPFVEKHMEYLIKHPSIDTGKYLANLRLMTQKR